MEIKQSYFVGKKKFDTMEEAQAYAESQKYADQIAAFAAAAGIQRMSAKAKVLLSKWEEFKAGQLPAQPA